MTCTTTGCESPSELYLCAACIRDLDAWIDKVPTMRAELFITMAKLDKVSAPRGEGGNGMTKEAPLPLNTRAMNKRGALRIWQGWTAEQLAHDQHSGKFQPMLQRLIEDAEHIIDTPEDRHAYGTCKAETENGECQETIKAPPEAETATCPECGTTHPIKEKRKAMLTKAKGDPLPPREAREQLATMTGIHVRTKDFENWVYHRKLGYVLETVTTDSKPKRLYFPGSLFIAYEKMMDRRLMDKKVLP